MHRYEYFNLSVSSVKINFGVLDAVAGLDTEQLYNRALQEKVPYYKWHEWLLDIVKAWCDITKFKSHSPKLGANSHPDGAEDSTYKVVSNGTPRTHTEQSKHNRQNDATRRTLF